MNFLLIPLLVVVNIVNFIVEICCWISFYLLAKMFFGFWLSILIIFIISLTPLTPIVIIIIKILLPWVSSIIYQEPINWFSFMNVSWMLSLISFVPLMLGLPVAFGFAAFGAIKKIFNQNNETE